MSDIRAKLNEYKTYFEEEIAKYFAKLETRGVEEPIFSALKYSVQNGGKRIRPALCFLGAEFMGHDKSDVLNFAIAIELIHSYSLVHDDLPSMDNDTLRRGKPTTHVQFGEGMAVLTGDALLNLAFEAGFDKANFTTLDVEALKYMADIAGIYGMVGGQCIDIRDNEKKGMTFAQLEHLYYLKTSKLISGALLSGAISCGANAEEREALELYARNVGIVFQIVDDILDVTSTVEELGKNIGSDSDNGKLTSLNYMSIDDAKKYIDKLSHDVQDALSKFGDRADDLIALSEMLKCRKK